MGNNIWGKEGVMNTDHGIKYIPTIAQPLSPL